MTSHDASPDFPADMPPHVAYAALGDFPEGSPSSYHAAFGVDLGGILSSLLTALGHEVDADALLKTAMGAAVRSFGDRSAILRAIVADATAIFPDPASRALIVIALNALAS